MKLKATTVNGLVVVTVTMIHHSWSCYRLNKLREHQAEGFLEGYVLTGRHGFSHLTELALRVVDSMITQHFKWLRSKTHAHIKTIHH